MPNELPIASSQALRLWSDQGIPHAEICARLHERSDLECYLAIRLLERPRPTPSSITLPAKDSTPAPRHSSRLPTSHSSPLTDHSDLPLSTASQMISRLAARLVHSSAILKVLEPALLKGLPPGTPHLPQFLELNALAVEAWSRATRLARGEMN